MRNVEYFVREALKFNLRRTTERHINAFLIFPLCVRLLCVFVRVWVREWVPFAASSTKRLQSTSSSYIVVAAEVMQVAQSHTESRARPLAHNKTKMLSNKVWQCLRSAARIKRSKNKPKTRERKKSSFSTGGESIHICTAAAECRIQKRAAAKENNNKKTRRRYKGNEETAAKPNKTTNEKREKNCFSFYLRVKLNLSLDGWYVFCFFVFFSRLHHLLRHRNRRM